MASAPARPDWRWARVVDVAKEFDSKAQARLKGDELALRALRFHRLLAQRRGYEYPDIEAAHAIYLNDPRGRLTIEGYLLAGADDEYIGLDMREDPATIKVYHDLFFEVRPGLDAVGWINRAVLSGVHKDAMLEFAHRVAWVGKIPMFRAWLRNEIPSEIWPQFTQFIRDTMAAGLAEVTATAARRVDMAPALMQFMFEETRMMREEAKETKASDSVGAALSKFLEGTGVTVADTTGTGNLELPAQEPRELLAEVIKS